VYKFIHPQVKILLPTAFLKHIENIPVTCTITRYFLLLTDENKIRGKFVSQKKILGVYLPLFPMY
jgi:hypothetical protein